MNYDPLSRVEDGISGNGWNYHDARAAEEYMAGQRLFAAVVHQALVDATLNPENRDNAHAVDSALHFLFDTKSPYFDLLDIDQGKFCRQLLLRMDDLNAKDTDFGRARKRQFQLNLTAYRARRPLPTRVSSQLVTEGRACSTHRGICA